MRRMPLWRIPANATKDVITYGETGHWTVGFALAVLEIAAAVTKIPAFRDLGLGDQLIVPGGADAILTSTVLDNGFNTTSGQLLQLEFQGAQIGATISGPVYGVHVYAIS